MDIRIRRVQNLDKFSLNLLRLMDHKCFPEDDPYKDWHSTTWWVVWGDHDIPMAFAGGLVWEPDHYFYLSRAGVLPKYRGYGIQRKLIQARHQHAKKLGLKGSYTYTNPENIVSSNNLIKSGFLLFQPTSEWAGPEFLYWYKET